MQLPRQYIHVQPFSTDNDLPDYDLDEEDCAFLDKVLKDEKKFDVDESTFEGMLDRSVNEGKTIGYCLKDTNTKADVFIVICSKYFSNVFDRLEKNSGHTVIEVHEAKSLLQEDDELILAGENL